MNLGALMQTALDDGNFSSDAASKVQATYRRYFNEAHRSALRFAGIDELRAGSLTFSTVANQRRYGLPQVFDRVDRMTDETNRHIMVYRTRDWLRYVDPGADTTGTPDYWIPDGLTPVQIQPSATGLWIASDSSSDTTQTASLVGVRSNGEAQAEITASLNGTTRVQFGTLTDYSEVLSWGLNASGAGNVSLYNAASSGSVLGRIPAGQTSIQYQGYVLWPTPSDAYTVRVDGQQRVTDLVQDTDVPQFPDTFHDGLLFYVRWRKALQDGNQNQIVANKQEWERFLIRLRSYVQFPADYNPRAGSAADAPGWNNLGPYFPRDTGLL